MINLTQVLIKTAVNYIAFKTVKSTVDYATSNQDKVDQYSRAVECQFCLSVWANHPSRCPSCSCPILKKLYRDYDYKKYMEENGFEIDTSLTLGGKK